MFSENYKTSSSAELSGEDTPTYGLTNENSQDPNAESLALSAPSEDDVMIGVAIAVPVAFLIALASVFVMCIWWSEKRKKPYQDPEEQGDVQTKQRNSQTNTSAIQQTATYATSPTNRQSQHSTKYKSNPVEMETFYNALPSPRASEPEAKQLMDITIIKKVGSGTTLPIFGVLNIALKEIMGMCF